MRTLVLLLVLVAAGGCGGDRAAIASAERAVRIADVQGSGARSPFVDQAIIVEGIVTGDFQNGDADASRNLGGFFVQGKPDGDATTSDGLFVFDGGQPRIDVDPGDRVRVSGTVVEHFGETQLAARDVAVIGTGAVEPMPVLLPVATTTNSDGERIADLEAIEGMLVRFPQTLTVSQLRYHERYGEMLLSEGGRQAAFTNVNPPDVAGYAAHSDTTVGRRIHVDDGRRDENSASPAVVRNGDEVAGLTGVVRFSRGSGASGTEAWRLMPTIDPQFGTANPRPGPPVVAGGLRVATINVNNFFSTIDDGRRICGPSRDADCRGADSDLELSRQLAKLVTVIDGLDAHIVALIELENNARASLQAIVDAVNAATGPQRYGFVDAGAIGDDTIKVGLIFQRAATRLVGDFAVLDGRADPRFDDTLHRPVLAQTFETVDGRHRLTVLAVHLKSKGSSCAADGDPDIGDGQGNCSATRSLAAAAMLDWIATDPTDGRTDRVLVIGDLNTYTMGDSLARFDAAGYANVSADIIGPGAYSFEFDGQFGALDHAVTSPALTRKVVDAREWHINADESRVYDYNLEFGRDPSVFNGSEPYRASDHDPLIIGIDFGN